MQTFSHRLALKCHATFLTETNILSSDLSRDERWFLPTACNFARYLGSGKGTCSCSVPGR